MLDMIGVAERQQQPLIRHFLAVGVVQHGHRIGRTFPRHAGEIAGQHAGIARRADRIVEITIGAMFGGDVLVAVSRGKTRAFLGNEESCRVAIALTSKPIMSAISSMPASGSNSISNGNGAPGRNARSQPLSRTRWRMDRITEGSELGYSMTLN